MKAITEWFVGGWFEKFFPPFAQPTSKEKGQVTVPLLYDIHKARVRPGGLVLVTLSRSWLILF